MSTIKRQDASRYDQRLVRGDRFYRAYAFRDDLGEPVDITGFSFQGQIRQEYDSVESIEFTISTAQSDDAVTAGVALDTVIVSLGGTATSTKEPGNYVYDIQKVMDADPSFVETFLRGNFFIQNEVTR